MNLFYALNMQDNLPSGMVGHHMLPPTEVIIMTASTYDMLGWEADAWILARRTQSSSTVKVRGGEEGEG